MEKPDEHGYVHVMWPSKNIPHGGIFHSRTVEPSEAQQQMVKLLLQESKLDIALRQKSAYRLRQQEEARKAALDDQALIQRMPMVRPRTSKRRSLSAIRESGIYELEPYKPLNRGEDREHLKEMLAHSMQYGESPEQPPTRVPPPPPQKPTRAVPTAKEQWHDLMAQIRERAEWLAEMEDLGQAAPHREVIHEQIAQRMRALKALDIDECMTGRSSTSGSGFSTRRGREPVPSPKGSGRVNVQSTRSASSQEKQKSAQSSAKSSATKQSKRSTARKREIQVKDEHISALNQGKYTPLEYTPRRRV